MDLLQSSEAFPLNRGWLPCHNDEFWFAVVQGRVLAGNSIINAHLGIHLKFQVPRPNQSDRTQVMSRPKPAVKGPTE